MPVMPPIFRPRGTRTRREHDIDRGTAHQRGYDRSWRKARLEHLTAYPVCVMCERDGVVTAAVVVDHIKPHRGDKVLFWARSNWQSLCASHHNREKQRSERAGAGRSD